MSLLQMSITGGIMILAITIIRALWLNRLPKKLFPVLWEIVLLRLLVPYRLPSVCSIYSFFPGDASNFELPEKAMVEELLPAALDVGTKAAGTAAFPICNQTRVSSLWLLWMAGAFLCAAYFIIAYVKCIREFKTALPVTHKNAKKWMVEHKIIRPITIRQLQGIPAPLTYGIFHPVILMPVTTDWDNTKQLPYVLEHEFIHIQRWDGLLKIILTGALCIHWFNPFVWLLAFLCSRDIELACDEAVVQHFGEETKADYALSLIHMEEIKSRVIPLCNHFGRHAIEERIVSIMKIKKTTVFMSVAAIMLVIGVTAMFATSKPRLSDEETGTVFLEEAADSAAEAFISEEEQQKQQFKEYEKFHIVMKNGVMYYKDEPVRYFLDGYEYEDGAVISRYQYYNGQGTIDVHTVYPDIQNEDGSTTLFGDIVSIQPYSREEFQKRVFTDEPSEAVTEAVAESDGSSISGTSFQEIFAAYEKYGITYEEEKHSGSVRNVYFNGELVKKFIDINQKGGTFSFESSDGGNIIVQTVYDEKGNLTGVKAD